MENKIDLKKLIFNEMRNRKDAYDAITYVENYYYDKIPIPIKSIQPVLKTNHTSEDIKKYLQEFNEYQKNNNYDESIKNYYTSRNEIEDIIMEYIKEETCFRLVPEIYKQNVWNKASLKYDNFYDLFCKLDNLTDIFNV